MSPAQFTSRWQTEVVSKDLFPEDAALVTVPPQQFAILNLPESTRQFLAEAGLPKSCAPFMGFDELAKGLVRIWERYAPGQWSPEEKAGLEHYLLIGSDDNAGNPICIDERDGRVVTVEHELLFDRNAGERRITFVNSGIPELAESLFVYQTTLPHDRLTALGQVDPPAVVKGTFWFTAVSADRELAETDASSPSRKPWWKFWK